MHDLKIVAKDFPEDIMKKAQKMRERLDIPDLLDSPFFIARFLRANNGDEVAAEEKINDFLKHRKILGYDTASDLEIFTEVPIGKETFRRFRISLVDHEIESNGVHVFVQKMEGTDLRGIMKAIPLSFVLHSYFMLQEVFGRAVAKTEKVSGKPSSVVSILDLKALSLTDFINPLSDATQLARLVVKVWAEYFSENLCKLLLINSPGVVSLMWQLTKHIVDAQTAERLAFINVEQLKDYLEIEAIPVEYGGTWEDKTGYADDGGICRDVVPVEKTHHKNVDEIWAEHGVLKAPKTESISLKSLQNVEVIRKATSAGTLIWKFTTNGDVHFEILKRDSGKEVHVWPKLTIMSLKLPEHGSIKVDEGEYIVRFTNPNKTWLPVRVSLNSDIFS